MALSTAFRNESSSSLFVVAFPSLRSFTTLTIRLMVLLDTFWVIALPEYLVNELGPPLMMTSVSSAGDNPMTCCDILFAVFSSIMSLPSRWNDHVSVQGFSIQIPIQ